MYAAAKSREIRGIGVVLAIVVPSLAFAAPLDPSIPPARDEPTRVAVTLTGDDPTGDLATTLNVLRTLAGVVDAAETRQLTRPYGPVAERIMCPDPGQPSSAAPVDPASAEEGLFFDRARLAALWPCREKAYENARFKRLFVASVRPGGVVPAVIVSSHPYWAKIEALTPSRQTAPRNPMPSDVLTPDGNSVTDAFRKRLCKSSFLPDCEQTFKVVPNIRAPTTDIYYRRVGYRVDLENPIARVDAEALRRCVYELVQPGSETQLDRGTVIQKSPCLAEPESKVGGAQKPSPGTGARDIVPAHGVFVSFERPRERPAHQTYGLAIDGIKVPDDLDRPWKEVHVVREAVEPTGAQLGSGRLILFDANDRDRPGERLREWFAKMSDHVPPPETSESNDCDWNTKENVPRWHTDAVAGVLTPRSLGMVLGGVSPAEPRYEGFVAGVKTFNGYVAVADGEDQQWWKSPYPVVAVVTQAIAIGDDSGTQVRKWLDILKTSKRVLLVVAAPKKEDVVGGDWFGSERQTAFDEQTVVRLCSRVPYIACLGPHPRVLLVAAGKSGKTQLHPEIYEPNKYVLGATAVNISAPGDRLPVIAPCVTAPISDQWALHFASGSSFAAPMVGVVLAHLIEADGKMQTRPEAAIWRILATADGLAATADAPVPQALVDFGQLNAQLALLGADADGFSADQVATIVPTGCQDPDLEHCIRRAIVMPYPWNDANDTLCSGSKSNTECTGKYPRAVLAYAEPEDKLWSPTVDIDFTRVPRMVHHSDRPHRSGWHF